MLQLSPIVRTSNGLNLPIWLNSSRICLLKHQGPETSLSIILNSLQTSRLDQALTQYLTAWENHWEKILLRWELLESPVHLICVICCSSEDNTNRVCVDYWKLNKLTEFDPEPMPNAEHLFQKLSGDKKMISQRILADNCTGRKHT